MGKMPEGSSSKITVVLTSCGRHDLLHKTMSSFFKYNTYPIQDFIVFEDGGSFDPDLKFLYPSITYFGVKPRIGQIRAIDQAYGIVKTPYIFHLEDDWEFFREGFIEDSLEILEKHRKIITVWLRSHDDTNKHPIEVSGDPRFNFLSTQYHWKGFTFNPGLRRLADYKAIGSYSDHTTWNPAKPWQSEQQLGYLYHRLKFKAAILQHGYVKHIGGGRHVK